LRYLVPSPATRPRSAPQQPISRSPSLTRRSQAAVSPSVFFRAVPPSRVCRGGFFPSSYAPVTSALFAIFAQRSRRRPETGPDRSNQPLPPSAATVFDPSGNRVDKGLMNAMVHSTSALGRELRPGPCSEGLHSVGSRHFLPLPFTPIRPESAALFPPSGARPRRRRLFRLCIGGGGTHVRVQERAHMILIFTSGLPLLHRVRYPCLLFSTHPPIHPPTHRSQHCFSWPHRRTRRWYLKLSSPRPNRLFFQSTLNSETYSTAFWSHFTIHPPSR